MRSALPRDSRRSPMRSALPRDSRRSPIHSALPRDSPRSPMHSRCAMNRLPTLPPDRWLTRDSFESRQLGDRRRSRESGQALLMVLFVGLLIAVAGGFLFAYGQALGSRGRYQRVADLSAMSAARVMRTSYPRLFEPPVLPDGLPNPMYMSKLQYLALARAAAGSAAVRKGVRLGIGAVTFPDLLSFAPTRVRVKLRRTTQLKLPSFGRRRSATVPIAAKATAAISPMASAG